MNYLRELMVFVRDVLISLRLTVALLLFGLVLVFAATLDSVNFGIWGVQEKWFRSFVVWQSVGSFVIPVFPGGYVIGGLLLAHLVVSHLYRFQFSKGKYYSDLVFSIRSDFWFGVSYGVLPLTCFSVC